MQAHTYNTSTSVYSYISKCIFLKYPAQPLSTVGEELSDLSADGLYVDDLSADDLSVDDLSVDDSSVDDLSVDDLSVCPRRAHFYFFEINVFLLFLRRSCMSLCPQG